MDSSEESVATRRRFVIKRRWIVLLSIVWIAAVYTAWLHYNTDDAGLNQLLARCQSFAKVYPDSYAKCVGIAGQWKEDRHAKVAATATLVAILPVATLWGLWASVRFLRYCR